MTFFFYDTETSGVRGDSDRIMQFGGQRTDMDLNPIGEPVNVLVKLTDDVLPDPYAILVHGITPQKTIAEGITENELVKLLEKEVFQPNTILVGFNNIRFDDEFLRFTLWRNLRDPYEWSYDEGRSRWDLLDAVRMTHALRPGGIRWPNIEGKPSHRLESLATANGIDIGSVHDALADVNTTIALARLMKSAQPKLWEWLLNIRQKAEVRKVISPSKPKPFLYTSGRYPSETLHTTAAIVLGKHADENGLIVYDLRHDPKVYAELSDEQLQTVLFGSKDERTLPTPAKKLNLSRSPAVAPLGTLDEGAQRRLKLSHGRVNRHAKALGENKTLRQKIVEAFASREPFAKSTDPDTQLYGFDFVTPEDRSLLKGTLQKTSLELLGWAPNFADARLNELLLRYKARNFPQSLEEQERQIWEDWRSTKLTKGQGGSLSLSQFADRLQTLARTQGPNKDQAYLLEELTLWAESIAPAQLFD